MHPLRDKYAITIKGEIIKISHVDRDGRFIYTDKGDLHHIFNLKVFSQDEEEIFKVLES